MRYIWVVRDESGNVSGIYAKPQEAFRAAEDVAVAIYKARWKDDNEDGKIRYIDDQTAHGGDPVVLATVDACVVGVMNKPNVRWYVEHNGPDADVMFEHLRGQHARAHERYMRLPTPAAEAFVRLANAMEQLGVAHMEANGKTLDELATDLAAALYENAWK